MAAAAPSALLDLNPLPLQNSVIGGSCHKSWRNANSQKRKTTGHKNKKPNNISESRWLVDRLNCFGERDPFVTSTNVGIVSADRFTCFSHGLHVDAKFLPWRRGKETQTLLRKERGRHKRSTMFTPNISIRRLILCLCVDSVLHSLHVTVLTFKEDCSA